MALSDSQKEMLGASLDAARVSQRTQSGIQLDYIEAWWAIAEANRIFGFDGWTRETVEMREVRPPESVSNKWRVGFMAKVRVTVGAVIREGTGFGSGIARDLGDAYESAVKEAESDAMKRALMTFGNPFGLALYDKSREFVGPPPKSSASLKRTDGNGEDEWARRTKQLDQELADTKSLFQLNKLREAWRSDAKEWRWPKSYLRALGERFEAKEAELKQSQVLEAG